MACHFCGAKIAPFGFGLPGFRHQKPEGKRGYLWTCHAHIADGEARRADAIDRAALPKGVQPQPQPGTAIRPDTQGSFGF